MPNAVAYPKRKCSQLLPSQGRSLIYQKRKLFAWGLACKACTLLRPLSIYATDCRRVAATEFSMHSKPTETYPAITLKPRPRQRRQLLTEIAGISEHQPSPSGCLHCYPDPCYGLAGENLLRGNYFLFVPLISFRDTEHKSFRFSYHAALCHIFF